MRKSDNNVVSILDHLPNMSQDGKDFIAASLSYKGSNTWNGMTAVPPGSILEDIIEMFRAETDIPLELPMMATLAHVSGYLNSMQVKIDLGMRQESPKQWVVVLAPSGSGKTFAINTIERLLRDQNGERVVPMLDNASSAAKFVDNIEKTPRGLWVRDEFGQFLSQINNLQHMEEIKDVLLRAYSGDPIDRKTRGHDTVIEDHALSILGITVQDTFEKQIGADSLVDGFAQRFNFVIAEADPQRPITDFPIYFENPDAPEMIQRLARIRAGWHAILGRNDIPEAVFTFEREARDYFKHTFRTLFGQAQLPGSFYRRCMFSMFSYAVVFHVLSARMGTAVGIESMSLAARMIGLHLDHARKLLDGYGFSELEKAVRKAEALRDRFQAAGRKLQPRDLVSAIREVRTAAMARELMELMR